MNSESPFERSEREFFNPTHDFQEEMHGRCATRETVLTEYPFRPAPDISLICEKCSTFISLDQLKDHRNYHKALTILRYGNDEPKNSDTLLKRRNFVMRKLKSSATKEKPVTPAQISEINDAYEYLKSIVDGTFEEYRQVREDVNSQVGGVALNCSPDCVYAVGIAASGNERWKSYMEDTRTFQDCFGEDKRKCFFGLYDGYHGRFAAEVAASELHKLLLSEMIKFDPRTKSVLGGNPLGDPDISHYKFERPETMHSERVVLYDESVNIIQNIINMCEEKYDEMIKKMDNTPENSAKDKQEKTTSDGKKKKKEKTPFERKMESAFSKAYYLLDILLSYGKDENSRIRWSGCSATTCVIQDLLKEEQEEDAVADDTESEVSGLSASMEPPKTVGKIHIANAGNVKGVLVRGNRAYTLTKDHTPDNKKERNRVLKDGGNLTDSAKQCCVNGVLLTTRGLGNHGDLSLKKCVLVEPHTMTAPIDQYAQFMILASRGVWEVFTEKEAASLLIRLLPSNQIPAPGRVNSSLQPLFGELYPSSSGDNSGSRRISFPSRESPVRRKSMEVFSSRKRSATLESVAESRLENQSNQSAEVKNGAMATKGQTSEEEGQRQKSDKEEDATDRKLMSNTGNSQESLKGQISDSSSAGAKTSVNHSTPDSSQARSNDKRAMRKNRKYVDADMQTEVGSQNGDSESDSGNEGDVDSYLENVSFPGSISRISMIDGPPSREQIQRNQAQTMAQHLVQAALLAGAKDNITAMVVLLPGSGL